MRGMQRTDNDQETAERGGKNTGKVGKGKAPPLSGTGLTELYSTFTGSKSVLSPRAVITAIRVPDRGNQGCAPCWNLWAEKSSW